MRTGKNIHRTMIRVTVLLLIFFLLLAGSCSSRKKKLDRSGLIPDKELVSILTDLYIADGLLTLPKVHAWFPTIDTTSSYNHIIEKHGYTKDAMNKTMKYFFIKNPKKLIHIYDLVLGILSEMESRIEKQAALFQDRINDLWPGKDFYYLPDQKGDNSTDFNILLANRGIYALTFTVTLFPNDQSVNSRFTAFTCHPDSLSTGRRKYYETLGYIKDGKPQTYKVIIKVPALTTRHLSGRLFDSDNIPGEAEKNVILGDISVIYTFMAE